jgi:site-specific recombinase XerD
MQKNSAFCRVFWRNFNPRFHRNDARCLSARTALCLRALPDLVDWPAEMAVFEATLVANYPWTDLSIPTTPLVEVLLDASAWCYLHLSPILFSHIEKATDMPVLPEHVWDRIDPTAPKALEQTLDEATDHFAAIALDQMFDPENATSRKIPTATINLLKSIFSVGRNDAGIRLADYLARSDTRIRLSLATTAISSEGWISGMLASWCFHLLNHGSIKLKNPSIATLSAYTSELLEPFARQLLMIEKTPHQMQQDDWAELFDHLSRETSSTAGIAALRSLHLWAVQTCGCDPLPSAVFHRDEDLNMAKANVIWLHEQRAALDLTATGSLDERVCHQTLVILTLGLSGLFRIGDIAPLRVDDIHESAEGIRVTVDPSHGSHGGKSRGARRAVLLDRGVLAQAVLDFKSRRVKESCRRPGDVVYLFGDPNQPSRLYRYGHSIGLVNQILKEVTGDSSVSFHTLRHTSATARGFALLLAPAADHAVSPLHMLLHQMGHAGAETFWSVYFHFADLAIRIQLDRAGEVRNVTAQEAAFWLNTNADSMRQRRHRSASSNDDFYFSLLTEKAFGPADLSHHSLRELDWKIPSYIEIGSRFMFNFPWAYKALRALYEEPDIEVLALRLSCKTDHIKQLCLAVQTCMEQLHQGRTEPRSRPIIETSTTEFCIDQVRPVLQKLKWSFDTPAASALHSVIKHLGAHGESVEARKAANAWRRMYVNQALTIDDKVDPRPLLSLLASASFPVQALVVRSQAPTVNMSAAEQARYLERECEVVQPMILETMAAEVRVELTKPRRGHPTRYLMARSSLFSSCGMAPAAGFRMSSFHGVFFTVLVLHHLISLDKS